MNILKNQTNGKTELNKLKKLRRQNWEAEWDEKKESERHSHATVT